MASTFIPRPDVDKLKWLKTFVARLPIYAAKYNISADECADMVASAIVFAHWLDYKSQLDVYVQKMTAFKNELRDGLPFNAQPSILPTAPLLAAPTDSCLPGIFVRAASLAARIKGHIGYTDADGKDLGIVAATAQAPDTNAKPTISARLISGGHPEIVWNKQGMDGVEIYVDRGGNGNYALMAYDSHPNYTDTAALPEKNTSALWKYKAIYRLDDEQMGQWSDEISISVIGG